MERKTVNLSGKRYFSQLSRQELIDSLGEMEDDMEGGELVKLFAPMGGEVWVLNEYADMEGNRVLQAVKAKLLGVRKHGGRIFYIVAADGERMVRPENVFQSKALALRTLEARASIYAITR